MEFIFLKAIFIIIIMKAIGEIVKPPHIMESEKIIRTCLSMYQPGEIYVSFNGGKDITAASYILIDTISKETLSQIQFVHFQEKDEFPELVEFIDEFSNKMHINVKHIQSNTIYEGVINLVNENNCKAIIMGTRSTDPSIDAEKGPFQPTSTGWPNFMRVYPVFQWTYTDIWDYLQGRLYCSLYDKV